MLRRRSSRTRQKAKVKGKSIAAAVVAAVSELPASCRALGADVEGGGFSMPCVSRTQNGTGLSREKAPLDIGAGLSYKRRWFLRRNHAPRDRSSELSARSKADRDRYNEGVWPCRGDSWQLPELCSYAWSSRDLSRRRRALPRARARRNRRVRDRPIRRLRPMRPRRQRSLQPRSPVPPRPRLPRRRPRARRAPAGASRAHRPVQAALSRSMSWRHLALAVSGTSNRISNGSMG